MHYILFVVGILSFSFAENSEFVKMLKLAWPRISQPNRRCKMLVRKSPFE